MCMAPNSPDMPKPPQAAKPAVSQGRRDKSKNRAGPSTLLTGPGGITNSALNLGGTTLLA